MMRREKPKLLWWLVLRWMILLALFALMVLTGIRTAI